MLTLDLLPTPPHQDGMIPRPELRRLAERYDEVSCYDTGRHTVRPGGMSRVGEGDPSLNGRPVIALLGIWGMAS